MEPHDEDAVIKAILGSVGGTVNFFKIANQALVAALSMIPINPVKDEKSIMGTHLQAELGYLTKWPRRKRTEGHVKGPDYAIGNLAFDLKHSFRKNSWTFPTSSYDKPCLVWYTDLEKGVFGVGVIVARKRFLRRKSGWDKGKKSLKSRHIKNIRYIFEDRPIPRYQDARDAVRDVIRRQLKRL